jgi:hypothetical protein
LEERRRRLREREELELAAMEASAAKALQQKVRHFCIFVPVSKYFCTSKASAFAGASRAMETSYADVC